MNNTLWTCPVCGKPLQETEKNMTCPQKHSYDKAKEGYVHLLPVEKRHAKVPGDTKEMVQSRRLFLQQGGYAPFLQTLCTLVEVATKEHSAPTVLDVGCGEGYYLRGIEKTLQSQGKTPDCYGIDIAKYAVRLASKAQKTAHFAVASAFALPVASNSIDVVCNLFSPMVPQECYRVLKPGGMLVYAIPTPKHLWGLKTLLYEVPYENEVKDTPYEGFQLVERNTVETTLELNDPALISALFQMTPYYWKTPKEGCQRLANATTLTTPIGFTFLVYQKEP